MQRFLEIVRQNEDAEGIRARKYLAEAVSAWL